VREFYLAMMTLAFGLIFREVVWEWDDLTGGAVGLSNVPSTTLRTLHVPGYAVDGVDYFRVRWGCRMRWRGGGSSGS
jgi:branched-chain amino acid transport system permease protein